MSRRKTKTVKKGKTKTVKKRKKKKGKGKAKNNQQGFNGAVQASPLDVQKETDKPSASNSQIQVETPTGSTWKRRLVRIIFKRVIPTLVTLFGIAASVFTYWDRRPYMTILSEEPTSDKRGWILHMENKGQRPARHLKVAFRFIWSRDPEFVDEFLTSYRLPPLVDRGDLAPNGVGRVTIDDGLSTPPELIYDRAEFGVIFGIVSYSDAFWPLPPQRICLKYNHIANVWTVCDPNGFLRGTN